MVFNENFPGENFPGEEKAGRTLEIKIPLKKKDFREKNDLLAIQFDSLIPCSRAYKEVGVLRSRP